MKSHFKVLTPALLALSALPLAASACDRGDRPAVSQHAATQSAVSHPASIRYLIFVKRPEPVSRKQRAADRVLPMQAAAPMTVDAGASYRMTGHQFGLNVGSVMLTTKSVEIQCDIQTWSPEEVTFQMPAIRISRPTRATLRIVLPTHETVVSKAVLLKGLQIEIAEPTLEPILQSAASVFVPSHPTPSISTQHNHFEQPISSGMIDSINAPLAPRDDPIDGPDSLRRKL